MTVADFKAILPQFSGVADLDVQRWMSRVAASPGLAADRVSDGDYTEWLANATAWGLVDEGGIAGVPPTPNVSNFATVKKVGTEQIEYSEAMMAMVAEDPFQSNKYGRRAAAIARRAGRGAVAI